MLEKNKDYVEMRVSSTDCAFTQNEPTSICIDGYVYTSYIRLPDPGELYILISKEKFEKLLDKVVYYMALSTRHEANYNLLLEKTGFTSVADLVDYIHDPSMTSPEDKTLREIIDECEEDYISERDKAEELQTENEQLKKKLEEKTAEADDPLPDFRELLKKLYSTNDVENLEWTLNHVCGGRGSVNGWIAVSSFWKQKYETLSKLVGFVTVEETRDYLTNEAECDTLHEAILKLKDQVKYTCDEWYSANSRNNSWKAAAECNTPKELIEKLNLLRDDISGHDTVIKSYERNIKKWQKATGCLRPEEISAASIIAKAERLDREVDIYTKALQEWKDVTGYPSPSAVKIALESGASWYHAYSEAKEVHKKLADSIKSWQNVTGYSTPEDFLSARINTAMPFDYTAAWQTVTGCDSPQEAGVKINNLCDEICKLKGDYDRLLKLTGYKSEDDICMTLNHSEQFVYETLMELVNSLKRKAKFTDSNWETATGFSTPEKCCSYIDRLEKKLEDIKNLTEED